MDYKTCSQCGQEKPTTEFYRRNEHRPRKTGFRSPCKMCRRKYNKTRNLKKAAERNRLYRKRNPEKHKAAARKKRERLKDEVFAAYGGYVCACCGEIEPLFMTIDHINDNGAEHRKELFKGKRNGNGFYLWLKKHNYPKGFRVLCFNCNCGRARNNGVCPHKAESNY